MGTYGGGFSATGAVSASSTGTGTIYAGVATGFAVVSVIAPDADVVLEIRGVNNIKAHVTLANKAQFLALGPGQSLYVSVNAGGSLVSVNGVEFSNNL